MKHIYDRFRCCLAKSCNQICLLLRNAQTFHITSKWSDITLLEDAGTEMWTTTQLFSFLYLHAPWGKYFCTTLKCSCLFSFIFVVIKFVCCPAKEEIKEHTYNHRNTLTSSPLRNSLISWLSKSRPLYVPFIWCSKSFRYRADNKGDKFPPCLTFIVHVK